MGSKNTIRDGISTARETAYTIYTDYTASTADTADSANSAYTLYTAFNAFSAYSAYTACTVAHLPTYIAIGLGALQKSSTWALKATTRGRVQHTIIIKKR